jgi:uracil phosphoribosyltransferase
VREKVTRLRDEGTPPPEFRRLVHEIGMLVLYEATADLGTVPHDVRTPLAPYSGVRLAETIGLVPVLRAGIGMVEAALQLIPEAQVWHIGLFRDEHTLRPIEYYNKLPSSATAQVCLVLDPMLATGGSSVATIDILKKWGARRVKYVGLIASPEGVKALSEAHPDVPIHVAELDERLDERGYIVPGLGDAGDRQFGTS